MKQLLSLFLLLLPCLAWAQYPSNGNQKITLGEQTTADGLIWRGVAADTTTTVKSDTAAYFVLDTVNINLYTYKASATGRKWRQLGADTASIAYVNTYGTQTVNGAKTFTSAVTATRFNPTANTATGTGMFLPATNTLGFSTNGTEKMVLDANGNLGLGVTPKNWSTAFSIRAFQVGVGSAIYSLNAGGTNIQTNFLSNAYFTTSGYKHIFTGAASYYQQVNGEHVFYTAPSNNADADASFTFRMALTENGLLTLGVSPPSAILHIKAGTATASTAPLKFTSGTNLTTAEAGAMEFNGTNLFFSPSTTRHTVNHGLTGSATLDFPSTTTLLSADLTITVTGAADGDVVSLGVPNAAVNANTSYSAWVSAANTVTVRFNNYSSGTVNPASGSFKVFVTK